MGDLQVDEAKVLRLQPGDVLALVVHRPVTEADVARIRTRAREAWPHNEVLVCADVEPVVLRAASEG